MGNGNNTPPTPGTEQAPEATNDAEAMDVVVEAYDPRPNTVDAAEHPGPIQVDRQQGEGNGQSTNNAGS